MEATYFSALEDVVTILEAFVSKKDCMDCNELEGYCFTDLILKFDTQEAVALRGEVLD